jgi:hypothetical protein
MPASRGRSAAFIADSAPSGCRAVAARSRRHQLSRGPAARGPANGAYAAIPAGPIPARIEQRVDLPLRAALPPENGGVKPHDTVSPHINPARTGTTGTLAPLPTHAEHRHRRGKAPAPAQESTGTGTSPVARVDASALPGDWATRPRYRATAWSVMSRALSRTAKPSASWSSVMVSGGFVMTWFQCRIV